MRVRAGQRLSLEATHDDHHVSTLRIVDVRREQVPDSAVGHRRLIGLPVMQDGVVALDWAAHS